MLRSAKELGMASRPEIVICEPDPDFALHYLTESIRYDLGDEEKAGLALFREFLEKKEITKSHKEIIYY